MPADSSGGGAAGGFDAFFYGVGQQESGGNYASVNGGSGALGKYQIMPANVGAWSQKYMGTAWTPRQFLGDPYKQEALAKAVLGDYYAKWGARGAASAWYSGNPALNLNYNSQNGGPSIGAYVDQVIGRTMGYPGTPGTAYQEPRATTTIDNTVQPKAEVQLPGSAGVGAVSAPGVDAVTAPGAGTVDFGGAQAVGVESPRAAPAAKGAPAQQAGSNVTTKVTGAQGTAIAAGQRWLGTPYVFGGGNSSGPSRSAVANGNFADVGFDCSGFVQYALASAGIAAPRLSYDQLQMGPRISLDKMKPGDLVGFGDGGHLALYEGNGRIIEAAKTGTPVRERTLGANEGAWGVSISGLYK